MKGEIASVLNTTSQHLEYVSRQGRHSVLAEGVNQAMNHITQNSLDEVQLLFLC